MSDLKQRKEDFVTGLHGGTISEINLVTSVAIFAYFGLNLLNEASNNGETSPLLDFILNWVVLLFSMTLYSNETYLLITLLLAPCVAYYLYWNFSSRGANKPPPKKNVDDEKVFKLGKKPYITAYRSQMLIITCLAILAVDFPIFPRRFAKVETWGTSLMDLGVGSFVFSNGLVSSRSLLKSLKKPPFFKRLMSAFKSCHTLLILGLLRLYFVKNLEYQEHTTEYGIHWNFFITLSLLPIALVLVDPIAEYIPRFFIASTLSCVYEWFLVKDEKLISYLILADRTNLVSANREGIVSFIGYCSIFLWGQSTGFYLLGNTATKNNLYKNSVIPLNVKKNEKTISKWDKYTTVNPLTGLICWFSVLFVITSIVVVIHPQSISRRFANLPYVLWVVTYNLGYLCCYCAIDKIFKNVNSERKTSLTLEAMNSNGLILFLLANVSTGVVNMSISTIDCSDVVALSTLLAYSVFIAVVATVLYKKKIFIRL